MIKSPVTFFRKQLKVKGKTTHSGRGFYIMDFDCCITDLSQKVEDMIKRTSAVTEVARDGQAVRVTIKRGATEQLYYRHLIFDPSSYFPLIVGM